MEDSLSPCDIVRRYPCIVHWFWSAEGWFSPFNKGSGGLSTPNGPNIGQGMLDFAGSGVVHLVGGIAGLMGSIFTGPRLGRFDADGKVNEMPGHSATLVTLGTFMLWCVRSRDRVYYLQAHIRTSKRVCERVYQAIQSKGPEHVLTHVHCSISQLGS